MRFTGPELDKYFSSAILNGFDTTAFPPTVQILLNGLIKLGAIAAPRVFKLAMNFVWEKEVGFTPQALIDEMDGIAEGMCSTLGSNCNVDEWKKTIHELNMLPELIRMACTAYGAWGQSTAEAHVIQLRALDFGGGPFANFTILTTHRGDPANPNNAFVSVSFPAFVGVITGVSQGGIGVSEKVWMVQGLDGLLPGSFNGEADIFVLRDILEYSHTRQEAETYMQAANKTWAIWVGVGSLRRWRCWSRLVHPRCRRGI